MHPEDFVDIEYQLDELIYRLSWFALDDATEDDLLWAFAEWIADMAYGYGVGRFDNWERRFVRPLDVLAEVADALMVER